MKKIIPYLAISCFYGFTFTNVLPVAAGGCNSNLNKTAKIKCAEDDSECKAEKTEMFDLKESVQS